MTRPALSLRLALLAATAFAAAPAHAQSLDYEGMDGGDAPASSASSSRSGGSGARTTVRPYIEAVQNVLWELSPGDDVLTYSSLAAGVDVALRGRRTEGAISVRYERRISQSDRVADGDTLSGLARVRHDLIPRTLSVEAGALATRSNIGAGGASALNALANNDAVSQIYSLYAGPALSTNVGDVAVSASYLVGYNRLEQENVLQGSAGQPLNDIFDDSVVQSAQLSAGVAPGTVLPVGVTASGSYFQEDISNLDQRVRDVRGGVQVTLPVSMSLAVVGAIGYED
ncbi:MAG: preprotein translocase subunit YajC, partial [Novosphingobium sp. 35-62-5]